MQFVQDVVQVLQPLLIIRLEVLRPLGKHFDVDMLQQFRAEGAHFGVLVEHEKLKKGLLVRRFLENSVVDQMDENLVVLPADL